MQYFVGYRITGEAGEAIERLREEVEVKFGVRAARKFPAHLTVFTRFETDDERAVSVALEQLVSTKSPFFVPIDGFRAFVDERVAYLDVEQGSVLKKLRTAVADLLLADLGIREVRSWPDMHFHVTLAFKDVTTDTLASIEDFLRGRPLPAAGFTVDALSLFQYEGDGAKEVATFRFGQG